MLRALNSLYSCTPRTHSSVSHAHMHRKAVCARFTHLTHYKCVEHECVEVLVHDRVRVLERLGVRRGARPAVTAQVRTVDPKHLLPVVHQPQRDTKLIQGLAEDVADHYVTACA